MSSSTTSSHTTRRHNACRNPDTTRSNNYTHVSTQVDDYKVDLPCLRWAHGRDNSLICREGTREPVIEDIRDWIFSKDAPYRVYFLIGGIHSGKTTISHTIAKTLDTDDQPTLASAIFLPLSVSLAEEWKYNPVTAQMVVNTIAVDLASYNASIGRHMSAELQRSPRSRGASATHLFRQLIVASTAHTASDLPIVIILDVLDRVHQPRERAELLRILAQDSIRLPSNVRILVTARPRIDVLKALRNDRCVHQLISLHDEPGVDLAAVTSTAESELTILQTHCTPYFPRFLTSASQGPTSSLAATSIISTFLTLCSSEERACFVNAAESTSNEIPGFEQPGHFYFLILWATANYGMGDHMTGELSLLSFLMEPRPANAQSYFPLGDVKFDDLSSGSIYSLIAPAPIGRNNTKPNPVFTLHPDIIESIVVPPPQVLASPPDGYPARDRIAELCLQILCDKIHPSPLSIDATLLPRPWGLRDRIQKYISKQINYASRHVIGHVTIAVGQSGLPRILELLQQFLYKHVLHWLELLSHLEAFGKSTILDLEELLQCLKGQPDSVQSRDELCKVVSDVIEFARRFSPLITMDPLHLPLAAAYSPRTSSIYQTLQGGSPVRVISGIPENWGPCLGVIESTNHSITLSPDGRRLAVNNGRIGIWDTFTRCHLHDLSSKSTQQHAFAFSSDGARISSASDAGPQYLWDVQTGKLVHDLTDHTSVVSVAEPASLERPQRRAHQRRIAQGGIGHGDVSTARCGYLAARLRDSPDRDAAAPEPAPPRPAPVAYSPDGKSLACASLDHTLRIWDLDSGEAIGQPLSEHTDSINGVTYSPDGRYLASASNDKTVRIWDSSNHLSLAQLDHPDRVHGLAWSPDGAFVGTGCNDHTVRLWDAKTHSVTFQLTGHINSIRSVAFTPDSSGLVSGSDDMSIRIWGVATGTQVGDVLRGHTDYIHSIVICPDGRTIISGSQDHTIRFWDMRPRVDAPALAPVANTRAAKTFSIKISQFTDGSGFLLNDGWIRSPSLRKLLWVPHPYRGQIISREDGRLVIKGRNQTGDTVEELVLEFL